MNTDMRTYYDVLGVTSDTPDVVIKAAYRALAKLYHPDGAEADPQNPDKFIEIQTAYSVLSRPQSRGDYDAELREAFAAAPPQDGTSLVAVSGATWQQSPDGVLEIERICTRLALYSEPLSHSFRQACLSGECGNDPAAFAATMEENFFREYFGDDQDVQGLARLLLLGSRSGAAMTLNQVIANAAPSSPQDIRGVLPLILEQQNFKDEALFTEWLKVKFGLQKMEQPPHAEAGAGIVPPAAGEMEIGEARRGEARQHPVRAMAVVVMWAVTFYFTLFAALPLLR